MRKNRISHRFIELILASLFAFQTCPARPQTPQVQPPSSGNGTGTSTNAVSPPPGHSGDKAVSSPAPAAPTTQAGNNSTPGGSNPEPKPGGSASNSPKGGQKHGSAPVKPELEHGPGKWAIVPDKGNHILKFSATTTIKDPNPGCTLTLKLSASESLVPSVQCTVADQKLSASLPMSSSLNITPGHLVYFDLKVQATSGLSQHFAGAMKLPKDQISDSTSPTPQLGTTIKDQNLHLEAATSLPDSESSQFARVTIGGTESHRVAWTVSNGKMSGDLPLQGISQNLRQGSIAVDLEFPENSGHHFLGQFNFPQSEPQKPAEHLNASEEWYSLPFLRPLANLFALLGLFFALGGLVWMFVVQWRERRKRRAQRSEVEDLSKRLNDLQSTLDKREALDNSHQEAPGQNEAPGQVLISATGSLQDKLNEVEKKADSVASQISEIRVRTESLSDEFTELNRVGNLLYTSIQRDYTQNGEVSGDRNGGVDSALAAVVNRWIKDGASNRPELLSLARQAAIPDARLATLEDTGETVKGVSAFRFTDDGAWLWTPVPGTMDFWAVPADAQFMAMGAAPHQLNEMFDGMENARHGFRFETIYRPCRLRRVDPDGVFYNLVQRGVLKLKDSPAPAVPEPQPFDFYARSARFEQQSKACSGQFARMFISWMRKTEEKLDSCDREITLLQQDSTTPGTTGSQVTQEDLQRVWQVAERRLDAQHKSLSARILQLEEQLKGPATARFASTPTQAPAPAPPRAISYPSESVKGEPSSGLRPTAASVQAAASIQIPQSAQPAEEQGTPAAVAHLALEKRWHDAYKSACLLSDSKPEITEIPTPHLYVQRARNLRDELRSADRSANVSIVHVKTDSLSSTIEIHETYEDATREIVCQVCSEKYTWQLAVTFGAPGSRQIYVLFPGGTLGKSNFAPGYSALIEDIPSSIFTIEVSRPALLKLQDAAKSSYVVLQKMALESPVGGRP